MQELPNEIYLKIEKFAVFELHAGPDELLQIIEQFAKEWKNQILKSFICLDCGMDTAESHYDYYTVHDDLWLTANPADRGMLCLRCLSARLGRPLAFEDFDHEAPVNWRIKELYESTETNNKRLPYLHYGQGLHRKLGGT